MGNSRRPGVVVAVAGATGAKELDEMFWGCSGTVDTGAIAEESAATEGLAAGAVAAASAEFGEFDDSLAVWALAPRLARITSTARVVRFIG